MKTPQIKPMAGMAPLGFLRPVARDFAELAQRKANAPLRPTVAQASMDVGLFSDDARQLDLVDAVRRAPAPCCGDTSGETQTDVNGELQCCGCGSPIGGGQ